jgi:hypothetical protein
MGVPGMLAGLRGNKANSLNLIRIMPAEGFEMMMSLATAFSRFCGTVSVFSVFSGGGFCR